MAKKAYVGVANSPKNVKTIYVGGIDGRPKKVVKGYVGDATGHPKLFWGGTVPPPPVTGKKKIEFLEDYQVGQYYDLEFAGIEETIRYYINELNFINSPAKNYSYTLAVNHKLRIFFDLLDIVNNNIENIINYVLAQITNENEIIIKATPGLTTDNKQCRLEFYLRNATYNNIECIRTQTDYISMNKTYDFTQDSSKRYKYIYIDFYLNGNIRYYTNSNPVTYTAITEAGQRLYTVSGGYKQFPVIYSMTNIGIKFINNNIENYRVSWNFITSKADKVDNCYLDERFITVNNNGAQILAEDKYIYLPEYFIEIPVSNLNEITTYANIEIEIGDMDLHTEVVTHHPLNYMLFSRTTSDTRYFSGQIFIHSAASEEWLLGNYLNGQQYGSTVRTGITDKYYFENSTVNFKFSTDKMKIYKNNNLVCQIDLPPNTNDYNYYYDIGYGGVADIYYTSPYNMTIKKFNVYSSTE